MIRGSIELVTNDNIQGWIFSEDGKIRERTLLAFQGDLCVGAGRVNTFRADLADAGMGDGHLGFAFPISVPASEIGSVVLKLEGSDAILVQHGAKVSTLAGPVRGLERTDVRAKLSSLKWALKHGRIAQNDFDFLRILWSTGVYERGLVRRNSADDALVTDKAATAAAGLLEAYVQSDAQITTTRVSDAAEFARELARVAGSADAPVLALHTRERAALRVLEGSHVTESGSEGGARASHFVDYPLSPENLLVLDARVAAELVLSDGASVDVMSAAPTLA